MTGAVTGRLLLANGQAIGLPALRQWDICRTDGWAADSFTLTLGLTDGLRAQLSQAVRVVLSCQGQTVLTGMLDEHEIQIDATGTRLLLSGRGLGGLLLDNQVVARQYQCAYLSDILATYAGAYGLSYTYDRQRQVNWFSVATGNTAMAVIKGFCVHAGARCPRMDSTGRLVVETSPKASGLIIGKGDILSAGYRNCRYGVISHQTLIHQKTGAVTEATYPAFIRRGGQCRKVQMTSGFTVPATWRTASQRIAEARTEEYLWEVTLPGNFLCPPGTTVTATVSAVGLQGQYNVRQVRSQGGESGCTCTLTLYP